jgi:hypothetical protein
MKALFAYIVATYDIKFEEGKGVPREVWIAGLRFPGTANVMFRTRQKWNCGQSDYGMVWYMIGLTSWDGMRARRAREIALM